MKRFLQTRLTSVSTKGQTGGVAIIMLLGFIVLGVPLVGAASQTAAQLSRNSRVYDSRLTAMYSASAGVEVAIHKILSDPTFDDDLSPGDPSKDITVDTNGDTVTVTVTKIFSTATVQGQGIVLSKVLNPTSGPAGGVSPLTYTITLKNEGTSPAYLQEIRDELPPGASYDPGSTTGLTTDDPQVADGPTYETDFLYLNGTTVPYDWTTTAGSDQITGTYSPTPGTWTETPDYWDSDPFATGGLIPATDWIHKQRIKTATIGNKWRFKVQLISGAVVTDLFTSADNDAPTTWKYDTISHSAGNFAVLAGDFLRLRLEAYGSADEDDKRGRG